MRFFLLYTFTIAAFVVFATLPRETLSQLVENCKPADYKHVVKRSGCTSKEVGVKSCLGTCRSEEIVLDRHPFFVSHCRCCIPTNTKQVRVELSCSNPQSTKVVWVPSVTACMCQTCNWLAMELEGASVSPWSHKDEGLGPKNWRNQQWNKNLGTFNDFRVSNSNDEWGKKTRQLLIPLAVRLPRNSKNRSNYSQNYYISPLLNHGIGSMLKELGGQSVDSLKWHQVMTHSRIFNEVQFVNLRAQRFHWDRISAFEYLLFYVFAIHFVFCLWCWHELIKNIIVTRYFYRCKVGGHSHTKYRSNLDRSQIGCFEKVLTFALRHGSQYAFERSNWCIKWPLQPCVREQLCMTYKIKKLQMF